MKTEVHRTGYELAQQVLLETVLPTACTGLILLWVGVGPAGWLMLGLSVFLVILSRRVASGDVLCRIMSVLVLNSVVVIGCALLGRASLMPLFFLPCALLSHNIFSSKETVWRWATSLLSMAGFLYWEVWPAPEPFASPIATWGSAPVMRWVLGAMVIKNLWDRMATVEAALEGRREALVAAKEEVELRSQEKSEFLAAMSHELRTPMHGVRGLALTLEDTDLGEDEVGIVKMIERSAEDLLGLLDDVLDLSKIEARRLEFDPRPTSLRDLLEGVIETWGMKARARGLDFQASLGQGVPLRAEVDGNRLCQVLDNLLSNAVKYTSRGTIEVTVDFVDEELRCRVRDSGSGIAKERLATLFDDFAHAPKVFSHGLGGTGLGLALCRHLIQGQGGELRVDSELGIGSTFSFVLPVKVLTEQSHRRTAQSLQRVLVVDDEPLNRMLASRLLEKEGIDVVMASDGHEALRLLEDEPIDLILMDVQMPGLSGLETVRMMSGGGPKVIFLSADRLPKSEYQHLPEAIGVLTKPFRVSEVRKLWQEGCWRLSEVPA